MKINKENDDFKCYKKHFNVLEISNYDCTSFTFDLPITIVSLQLLLS